MNIIKPIILLCAVFLGTALQAQGGIYPEASKCLGITPQAEKKTFDYPIIIKNVVFRQAEGMTQFITARLTLDAKLAEQYQHSNAVQLTTAADHSIIRDQKTDQAKAVADYIIMRNLAMEQQNFRNKTDSTTRYHF